MHDKLGNGEIIKTVQKVFVVHVEILIHKLSQNSVVIIHKNKKNNLQGVR